MTILAPREPTLSMIVLAWHPPHARTNDVWSFLDSLQPVRRGGCEVVVVCNSADAHLMTRLQADSRIDVLELPGRNLGVAKGWNLGASVATGDILCFCNEDLVLTPSSMTRIQSAMQDPAIGLVGFDGMAWDLRTMRVVHGRKTADKRDVRILPRGHCVAVRKDVWTRIGGVDEELSPAFYEDVDLALRILAAGYQARLIGYAGEQHPWGVSSQSGARKIEWDGQQATIATIRRRNHKRIVRVWSSQKWRSKPWIHPLVYWPPVISWTASRWAQAALSRLGRTSLAPRDPSRSPNSP